MSATWGVAIWGAEWAAPSVTSVTPPIPPIPPIPPVLGAGFPVIFPDTGPLKQAKAPKKKKPKKPKVKRPKKPKRVKLKLPARDIPTIGEADRQGNTPKRDGSLPALLPLETSTKSVDTAAQRLRETITEEDELLLLIC